MKKQAEADKAWPDKGAGKLCAPISCVDAWGGTENLRCKSDGIYDCLWNTVSAQARCGLGVGRKLAAGVEAHEGESRHGLGDVAFLC